MWIVVNDVAVLKRARLRLVRVANQIDRPLFVRLDKAPLQTAGKSCPAATAQSGGIEFVDAISARHGQPLLPLFVTGVVQLATNISRPLGAPSVLEASAGVKGTG